MEKNQPFFDPYNFNLNNVPQQNNINQQIPEELFQPTPNPAMYYEQQYMYYRYLTQMMEYKIKLRDYERIDKQNKDCKS